MIILKTSEEIEHIRKACLITASVFEAVKPWIRPGVSTGQLNRVVDDTIRSQGATPSFLGYGEPPFPGAACISINEEVVHGIPSDKVILQDGDIVSVDVGSYLNGYHSDACRTFLCGNVSEEVKDLVKVTEESFWKAMEFAYPGKRLGDMSHAVQSHCEAHGYGIIRELSGHGIGQDLHEDPEILNYGKPGKGIRLESGMVLCLEPMVTLGSRQIMLTEDEWTIVTRDVKPASHYENTFVVTDDGPEILTCPERPRL